MISHDTLLIFLTVSFVLFVLSSVDQTTPNDHFWLAELLSGPISKKKSEPAVQTLTGKGVKTVARSKACGNVAVEDRAWSSVQNPPSSGVLPDPTSTSRFTVTLSIPEGKVPDEELTELPFSLTQVLCSVLAAA